MLARPSCINGFQKDGTCNYPSKEICGAYTVERNDIKNSKNCL